MTVRRPADVVGPNDRLVGRNRHADLGPHLGQVLEGATGLLDELQVERLELLDPRHRLVGPPGSVGVETQGGPGPDGLGHPRSEQMRVTERFRRIDFGHLDMEVTFNDPVMYTKPITLKIPHTIMADSDIFESFCDNEKDKIHLENANPRK